MIILKIIYLLKAALVDVQNLISRIEKESPEWDESERNLNGKEYAIALAITVVVFFAMIGLAASYKSDKLLFFIAIYSCILVGLLLLIFVLFGVHRWRKSQKTKEIIEPCIKQIAKLCARLGSVLFFFSRLFHSVFAFSPKRDNTIIYMVTLVFLDLQGLLFALIMYERHETNVLQFVSSIISANFDKYAVSYGIFLLVCVEFLGLINHCALEAMRKIEMYTARNQFKSDTQIEDTQAKYMESVERDINYDWEYIKRFCWLIVLGLMVLFFAFAVFSPETLFLENKENQSAFINVVALVSLIILMFDKRTSWLLNQEKE